MPTPVLDTRIDGNPAQLDALSEYLRSTVKPACADLALTIRQVSQRCDESWQGATGDAYRERLTLTRERLEELEDPAHRLATEIDLLADALRDAQEAARSARLSATYAGLTVRGFVVDPPWTTLATLGAAAAEARTAAWNSIQVQVAAARKIWDDARAAFARALRSLDADLVGLSNDLFTGTVETVGKGAIAYRLGAEQAFHSENATTLATHADDLSADGVLHTTPEHYYDLIDGAGESSAKAATAEATLKNGVRLSARVGRGLEVLGYAATAYAVYAVYDDVQNGESLTQAAASNVGGMAAGIGASMAAGAGAGLIVGSFIAPPAGTIAGAAVGAIVGATVGMFTSGVIDYAFESSTKSLGGAWDAGVSEIADTGRAVGDLVTGVWESLF